MKAGCMNLTQLHTKLIEVAKANPPGADVPYAFENRIIARLRSRPALDFWAQWSQALWRAAAPCVVIMLTLGTWAFFHTAMSSSGDLSQELENTVLAAATDQDTNTDSVW